jgi:hypothetical protein
MIRRNVASQTIYLPQLVLAADGAAVTASATLTVAKDGTESASDGTLAHVANGVWKYTPTQAETDAAIVGLVLTATNAVPVVLNLVTTAADTAAVAFGANTVVPTNLSAAQVRTELSTELGRIDTTISSRSTFAGGAVASVTDPVTVGTNNDKTGYGLTTGTIDSIRSGLSTLTAANVWDHATRSLTTFGTLVSDIWSAGSRTLTAISDSTGVTTLLTRIVGTLASGTHNPQSGDSFARLGAPAGASIAADIAAIDGGGSTLTGPWTRTITVTDSVSGDPIQNATVRFFRTGETESKATNTSGVASFTVEAATWNYAIVANGYAGASGSVVVSADGDTAVTMVANSPAPPLNPNNATLRVTCIGEDSQIAPGAVVSIRMIEAPAGQVGFGYDGTIATFTANSSGIAEREVARGATYEIRREGTYKQWQKFVMPTDQDLILITSFVQP